MRAQFRIEPVAITGIGLVCPLGTTREQAWQAVIAGRSGIGDVRRVDVSALSFGIAGEVEDLDPRCCAACGDGLEPDRGSLMVLAAAREAIAQARLVVASFDPYRVGVSLGSCQFRTGLIEQFMQQVDRIGYAAADPMPIIRSRMGAPADSLVQHLGLRGPKYVVSNACAAGGSAIGLAVDALRSGRADVVLAGGVDLLELYSMAGFDGLHAVDSRPCSPYSRSEGITIGEGAAVMVLERARDAESRDVPAIAYVAGYGLSSDAHHATSPDPGGRGAVRAVRVALRQAGLGVDDVDYVNGHGTGTRANDRAEAAAMRALFGDRVAGVPISSTKSQIGHTMGAAGAIGAAVTAQAVRHQMLPPTINVDHAALAELDLDIVPDRGRPATVRTALCNSFAFGGANCTVALTGTPPPARSAPAADRVVVTGVGVLSALGTADAFRAALHAGVSGVRAIRGFATADFRCQVAGEIEDRSHLRCIDPAYVRRLDQIGRLATAVSRMCFEDAGLLTLPVAQRDRAGVIFATAAGPVETMGALRGALVGQGADKVNPRIFPNAVMNAAAGHVCVSLQLRGPTTTLVGGNAAGLQALAYAADLVRQGEADVMLAVSADEITRELHGIYDRLGLLATGAPRPWDVASEGMVLGSGACALAVESLSHARQRGARILGEVLGHAGASDARPVGSVDERGEAWASCLRLALEDAGQDGDGVASVYGEGRGSTAVDRSELNAVAAVCDPGRTRLAALSPYVGHAQATLGPLQVVAALDSVATGRVPDVLGLDCPLVEMGALRSTGPVPPGRAALVSAAATGGTYAAVVVGPMPA